MTHSFIFLFNPNSCKLPQFEEFAYQRTLEIGNGEKQFDKIDKNLKSKINEDGSITVFLTLEL